MHHCEHLHCMDMQSDNCMKRYFNCFDPITGDNLRLCYCNDYLKLKVNEDQLPYTNKMIHYSSNHASNFISSLINSDLKLSGYEYPNRTLNKNFDPIGHCFITIVRRPYTYIFVSFKQMLTWYLDNRSWELYCLLRDELHKYVIEKEKYKKHFAVCKQIKAIFNKIQMAYSIDDRQILTNELILLIFKTFYNETN